MKRYFAIVAVVALLGLPVIASAEDEDAMDSYDWNTQAGYVGPTEFQEKAPVTVAKPSRVTRPAPAASAQPEPLYEPSPLEAVDFDNVD